MVTGEIVMIWESVVSGKTSAGQDQLLLLVGLAGQEFTSVTLPLKNSCP